MKEPREYWWGITDEQLTASAVEYLATGDQKLCAVAADIDDELRRRDYKRSLDVFEVIASDEEQYCRYELREYPNRFQAVYLRHRVGGGWLIRDEITINK